MLVVKVELWPFGDATRSREIGRIGIGNVSGSMISDYVAVLVDDTGRRVDVELTGHMRSDGFWPLISRASRQANADSDSVGLPDDVSAAAERIAQRMYP